MKPSVYIETTIIGYLSSRLSRDLITAAHQQITQDWWENHRSQFVLYVSELVIQEAGSGNPNQAQKRLDSIQDIPLLAFTEECKNLARELLDRHAVPQDAGEDALHIAVSTVHGTDYLLTWNCAHIANARMRDAIGTVCRDCGYEPPVICTPEELMGETL